jgi:hypothetical protein
MVDVIDIDCGVMSVEGRPIIDWATAFCGKNNKFEVRLENQREAGML